MQTEHIQAFQDTTPSTEPLPTSRVSTAQHGIHGLSTAPLPLSDLSLGAGAGGVRGIGDKQGSNDCAENTGMNYDSGGLGGTTSPNDDGNIISPSKQKKDIISKYEARGSSPPHCDTGFHVKKTNWHGRLDSPISRFPNGSPTTLVCPILFRLTLDPFTEVLIHSLSFLDPQTLLTASLISRRFHSLIASPDAWRSAFSRYFPSTSLGRDSSGVRESATFSSSQDRRFFTRLSAGGSSGDLWRKEYILRTRLLRNLAKGKTHTSAGHSGPVDKNSQASFVITYNALTGPLSVSHLAADFSSRGVRLLHASVDAAVITASDAIIGKVERPPLAAAMLGTPARPDLHQPILGATGFEVATDMETVGVMDLSEDVGWVYGENVPNGKCYVHPYSSPYRCASEKGFFLRHDQVASGCLQPAVTAVWIAKRRSGGVLETSEGQVGVMIGNSRGFVSMYGLSFGKKRQVTPTKMFCICPGIPIVSIKVDEDYSAKRKGRNSVWAAVVNALGEVYYLADPNVGWKIIPQTTRIPTVVHSSIFQPPPNTVTGEDMGKKKIEEKVLLLETEYTRLKQLWVGWGMDWFIEMDWPGTNVVLGRKGNVDRPPTGSEQTAKLVRYHLLSYILDVAASEFAREVVISAPEETGFGLTSGSVFGESRSQSSEKAEAIEVLIQPPQLCERPAKWVATDFLFGNENVGVITALAIDISNLTLLSPGEDPGITADVPGGNARLFAVGTNMGDVFIWNIRHQASSTDGDGMSSISLLPQRVIQTDSPRISTLALSSLYLVHGGNDGLVQAWDLLASTYSPVRSIHSRFSTRARRRLAQADAATLGPGNVAPGDNQFAARCLVLDPDPIHLRGAVALGTRIRYWCFSSSSLGPNTSKRSKKPRVGGRVRGTPPSDRSEIKGIIKSDSKNLLKEREREHKERVELEERYGISRGRAALSEEEMLEYAKMISMEAYETEGGGSIESGDSSNTITPKDSSRATNSHKAILEFKDTKDEVEDLELAQALRLSLEKAWTETPAVPGDALDSEIWEHASEYPDPQGSPSPAIAGPSHQKRSIPNYTNSNRSSGPVTPGGWPDADIEWPSVSRATQKREGKAQRYTARTEEEEFEMAIQLSMEEEERRRFLGALEAGGQSQVVGRGKGRQKGRW
ncbi:hypothetical protein C7212DRAFT_272810 [Tuber magnatum]|uniref:F-box domain-containing protein n=1 Tax=Tuber magnatum TaxID=42249 RepID=A0A317SY74_9PEZI|nr:hypothetical protein C7212DRAFT_272810 [Tuber magnatum]